MCTLIKHCSNYGGITILSNTYNILSNILLSMLTPYAKEIFGDHQCGFRGKSSATDHVFYILQMLEKKCEYAEIVHLLSIDFKKTYVSVRRYRL